MLPSRLGPYRIERKIGRGGMGTVYAGVEEVSGNTAAIKLLSADLAQQADFRERFESEIEALRKLNHPNIVRILGFGEEGEQLYYAMEYVAGSSLESQLARGRAFTWREAAQFGVEISLALRHAHDRGIIHRDIKPGNLLLSDAGQVKLSDFGIARLFGNMRLTAIGSVLGTAEYMAPEQAEGRSADPRSDLYSLGAVLYVLLARRPLFQARTFAEMLDKQRFERPAALKQLAVDIPAELEQIIHRLLEKDPLRRFATAGALARRLEALIEAHVVPPQGRTALGPMPASDVDGLESPSYEATPRPPVDPLAATEAVTIDVPAKNEIPSVLVEHPEGGQRPQVDQGKLDLSPVGAAGRFIPVMPGELDTSHRSEPAARWISRQTIAMVIGLLAMGLLAWRFLQPLSADDLYRRIEGRTSGRSDESLQSAEDDLRQFLVRFPRDPRCELLGEYVERIDLLRLERRLELLAKGFGAQKPPTPVERTYLDAYNLARFDPEAAIVRYQAMIDLFEPAKDSSGPTWQCIQLAKRRLAELQKQCGEQAREQRTLVLKRLNRADAIRATDPKRAAAICRAVIELYQNKAWAKEAVERARKSLEKEGLK